MVYESPSTAEQYRPDLWIFTWDFRWIYHTNLMKTWTGFISSDMFKAYGLLRIPSSLTQLISVVVKCDSSYLAGKVKSKNLFLSPPWRRVGAAEVQLHTFWTSALDGIDWLFSIPNLKIPGNETRYPLSRRLDGPQSRSGWFWGRKNLLLLLEFQPRNIFNSADIVVLTFFEHFLM